MFRNIFLSEEEQGGRGRPAAPSRNILNPLLYILTAGCKVVRFSARAAMGVKKLKPPAAQVMASCGTLNEIKAGLLGLAQNEGLICWSSGAVDGSFPPWERRRR